MSGAAVSVSPADPDVIAAVLRDKARREDLERLRAVQRRLLRRRDLAGGYRVICCRKLAAAALRRAASADPLHLVAREATIGDVEDMIREVATARRLTRAQVVSASRAPGIVDARHEVWWRLHHRLGLSVSRIGRVFGRDHTTVLHGVRRWDARLASERARASASVDVDELLERVAADNGATVAAICGAGRGPAAWAGRRAAVLALSGELGFSAGQIGDVLGMTKAAVEKRLARARAAARRRAGGDGEGLR